MPQQRAERQASKKSAIQVDRSSLDGMLGFQLRLAYAAFSRHFAEAMAHLDLTQKQTGVLWLIGANPGVSQAALAKHLDMDRASMMAIVDRLDAREIVVRKRSRHDGRRQELYLTPKGRRILKQSKAALTEHERWFTERFSEAELGVFFEALQRLHK